MDTFENNEFDQEQHTAPLEEGAPYHSAGTGRKESPFADSPYVAQSQPEYTQPTPKKVKRQHTGAGRRVLAVVLVLALVAGGCLITGFSVNARWERRAGQAEAELDQRLNALEGKLNKPGQSGAFLRPAPVDGELLTPAQLYEQNVSSVVAITANVMTSSAFGSGQGVTSGSGFFLTEDGYVVTNCHVVEDTTAITVTAYDGTEYSAKVVGTNAGNDIALLKVDAAGLPHVTLGSSDELAIGDMVVAIGNAMGRFANTQTVGYVSGMNRDVHTSGNILNMIQSDVAINPGNSGGPLFNMRGEVVGITTAKWSGTSSSGASIEGISFAIPIDDVKDMFTDLMDYGYVTGAYLGVTVREMNPEAAAVYGLPTGAYVDEVTDGSCAQKAGIQPKDIIIALGDDEVTTLNHLSRALRKFKAGDTTTITVIRGGQRLTLPITLDAKPAPAPAPDSEIPMPSDGDYEEWYDYFSKFFGKD